MNMVKPLPSGQHPMVSASVSYFIVIIWVDLSWLTCTIRQRYPFISTLIQWNIRTTHIVRNMYILIHYKALSYRHCFPDDPVQLMNMLHTFLNIGLVGPGVGTCWCRIMQFLTVCSFSVRRAFRVELHTLREPCYSVRVLYGRLIRRGASDVRSKFPGCYVYNHFANPH